MSASAQLVKNKGNTAFKAGHYSAAVEYYTTAILADPNDSTFTLNRAAAYLKLGKHDDAERDCTAVLRLNVSNVKAFFRRGQARAAQNKLVDAQKDYQEALKLEPKDAFVKQELERVTDRLSKQQFTLSNSSKTEIPSIDWASSQRRRIPIEIVEPSSSNMKVYAVIYSAELFSLHSRPSSVPSSDLNPCTSKEAQGVHQNTNQSRAGGGIFRSSGDHTLFTASAEKTALNLSVPKLPASGSVTDNAQAMSFHSDSRSNDVSFVKPLTNLFTFTRRWEGLRSGEERWRLISSVPAASLPSLFQTSLETSLLVSLLETFQMTLKNRPNRPEVADQIQEYMVALTRVPRFSTVLLFMNQMEKQLANDIWMMLGRGDRSAWAI